MPAAVMLMLYSSRPPSHSWLLGLAGLFHMNARRSQSFIVIVKIIFFPAHAVVGSSGVGAVVNICMSTETVSRPASHLENL